MARNNNSIETIQKTLDLAGQELRILHQISQSISSTLDLDQVLRQIVDLVIDVTHGDACLVYLLDETGDNLVLRASKNPHPRLIGKIAMRVGEGITGWVAKEVETVAMAAGAYENSSVRRLGYLLDRFGYHRQAKALAPIAEKAKSFTICDSSFLAAAAEESLGA